MFQNKKNRKFINDNIIGAAKASGIIIPIYTDNLLLKASVNLADT